MPLSDGSLTSLRNSTPVVTNSIEPPVIEERWFVFVVVSQEEGLELLHGKPISLTFAGITTIKSNGITYRVANSFTALVSNTLCHTIW